MKYVKEYSSYLKEKADARRKELGMSEEESWGANGQVGGHDGDGVPEFTATPYSENNLTNWYIGSAGITLLVITVSSFLVIRKNVKHIGG